MIYTFKAQIQLYTKNIHINITYPNYKAISISCMYRYLSLYTSHVHLDNFYKLTVCMCLT